MAGKAAEVSPSNKVMHNRGGWLLHSIHFVQFENPYAPVLCVATKTFPPLLCISSQMQTQYISSDFAIWLERRVSTGAFECTHQKLLGGCSWR